MSSQNQEQEIVTRGAEGLRLAFPDLGREYIGENWLRPGQSARLSAGAVCRVVLALPDTNGAHSCT